MIASQMIVSGPTNKKSINTKILIVFLIAINLIDPKKPATPAAANRQRSGPCPAPWYGNWYRH
jgi:hypothetical protein